MNTVLTESHTEFLTRRSSQMAGMIGLLSSRLEIVDMSLKFDMDYDNMTLDMWRRTARQARLEILECLIKYQQEWADMQQYEDGDVGMDMHKRKMNEYTTELNALKTLAL